MGYLVTCDWCRRVVKDTKSRGEIRAMLQDGEHVCDDCKQKIIDLDKFYADRRDGYVQKLERVHLKAKKDLEKFIKEGGHSGENPRDLGKSDEDISG